MYASSPKSRPPPIPPRGVQKPWPHKDQHEPWHHQSPADVSPAQQQGKSPKASPKETGFYEHGGRLFDTNHRAVPNFREALDDSKDPNSRWRSSGF
ncbi:hypothetical protein CDD82_2799 [Ophiocordyceps australis]|uniref:Uncharacterized protein n=1 Tax=Ophiocordyceps australis TaxID=1399860 RepID=A0A2C5XU89_9HYPO|nr:hypothetical protein CDD82_2799 [Ophiocordyceps australis]